MFMRALLLLLFSTAAAAAERPLQLLVHPYLPATELRERFVPLADYLAAGLGRPVHVQVALSYADHVQRIGRDEVDIAYLGPSLYLKTVREFGRKPLLARQSVGGTPEFRGVIVARRDGDLDRIEQLAGRRFAFGDPFSTMTHLVPRYMLLEAGIDVTELGAHEFVGNHRNIALGVLVGDFDAGAVKQEVYHAYRARGLKAIATSPAISEHLFVSASHLGSGDITRLRVLLMSLDTEPGGRAILEGIKPNLTALVPVNDADYDNLRRILDTLEEAGVHF